MMRRYATRVSQISIDLLALAAAFGTAFLVRFDWSPSAPMIGRVFLVTPYVAALEYAVLMACGVHRFSWRYIGLREIARILGALALASAALLLSRVVVGRLQNEFAYLRHGVVPFGVIAINFALSFLTISGVRVLRRMVGERHDAQRPSRHRDTCPTMLVGAGQGGVLVAREIAQNPKLGMKAVGFLDDDTSKHGSVIHGIPVLGSTADLAELCAERGAREVLITMANVPGQVIRRIMHLCEDARVPAKIIPGIYEIVGGRVNLSRARKVAIEDLLGRDAVQLDDDAISDFVRDRVVLVTGAGGSIGSELCRQLCRVGPRTLVLVEQAENALFQIHRELGARFPKTQLIPCIADITDGDRVESVFRRHRPSAVFHAAAHKHVPMMEWNPGEAVKNNVGGSRVVADAAHAHGCEAFVMISTDKAVNPSSVMGATKRIAELYVQSLSQRSTTRFVTVRFGNVLGSNGSVIPIFSEQIANGGPVTVTHPEMQRYFMTIPEACQLVLQAGTMGEGGEIFILDMGQPVKIVDLARDLITLSGLREGEDIDIVFSGVRPGEKLFEELSTDAERADKTRHPKIFVGRTERQTWDVMEAKVRALVAVATEVKNGDIRSLIGDAIPEYRPPVQAAPALPAQAPLIPATSGAE